MSDISNLTDIDPGYSCQRINPAPSAILKSEEIRIPGRLAWAYVPQPDDSLKLMVVFIPDNYPPVEQVIIENFSTNDQPTSH